MIWLLVGGLAVYGYYKYGKGIIVNMKIPNNQKFEEATKEEARLYQKIQNNTATITDKVKYEDLTKTLQYKRYGITSRLDLEGVCLTISTLFALGANQGLLYQNLMEISATESLCGTQPYKINRGYGYGLFQFDRIAFDDCKDIIQQRYKNEFLFIVNRNIDNVKYEDLQEQALLACFFCRVYLKHRIPYAIGTTLQERAKQWKQYYNTELGAGSVAGYIEKSKTQGVA